ncbi:tetratricopeptide repeat protein [Motilimonas eburnea]|uniref:tetratricopeptide repeat protein n=1 Tax=Motilimonas eburnea TaxID=1737488 RepID=UPI001E42720E|nr:hypothetical protein [Motilimonas eburnea]MCE2570721.1 hypothetical protein [Motilimonas eburnea]
MKWILTLLLLVSSCFALANAASQTALSAALAKQVKPAHQFYQQQQYQKALQVLKQTSPKAGFETAYVKRFTGNLYWLLDQPKAALRSLSEAVAEQALPPLEQSQTQRMLADLYLAEQQAKQALQHYRKVDKSQRDANYYLHMAQAYYQLEQWQNVVNHAQLGIKRSKVFNQSAQLMLLNGYYQLGQLANAAKVLQGLTEHQPDNKRWWQQLSSVYLQMNDHKRALSTLEIAYQANMLQGARELQNLARLRANAGLPYQAANLLAAHLDNGSLDANVSNLTELAGYWQQAREYQRAAKVWGKVAAQTGLAKHYMQQASLYSLAQDHQQAIKVLESLGHSLPAATQGSVALAKVQAYYALNQYQQALQYARQAQQQQTTASQASNWVALLENKLEDPASKTL